MTTATDKRIAGLPVEPIKRSVFDKLPEYSCSLPTGVTPGKVWRRNINAFDLDHRGEAPLWVIGEYVRAAPGECRTEWRVAEILEDT